MELLGTDKFRGLVGWRNVVANLVLFKWGNVGQALLRSNMLVIEFASSTQQLLLRSNTRELREVE
jgi:hypothetical protein